MVPERLPWNTSNSITKVVCFCDSVSPCFHGAMPLSPGHAVISYPNGVQSGRAEQGNNARTQEKNAGSRCEVRGAQITGKNARTQEDEKCTKVEGVLYLYGMEMYWSGDLGRK